MLNQNYITKPKPKLKLYYSNSYLRFSGRKLTHYNNFNEYCIAELLNILLVLFEYSALFLPYLIIEGFDTQSDVTDVNTALFII